MDKNLIDKDEYPQTADVEKRCVNMIANLWNGMINYCCFIECIFIIYLNYVSSVLIVLMIIIIIVLHTYIAPLEDKDAVGCSTIGSSEAAMLGGMAAKWRWKNKRKAAGLSTDKPNMVCGSVQICWKKVSALCMSLFARDVFLVSHDLIIFFIMIIKFLNHSLLFIGRSKCVKSK